MAKHTFVKWLNKEVLDKMFEQTKYMPPLEALARKIATEIVEAYEQGVDKVVQTVTENFRGYQAERVRQLSTGKKTMNKLFRLSESEAQLLKEKATANGMSESEYIRLMISQKPNDYPEIRKLLKEAINEINHIGININQIVKNNNSTFYQKEDKIKLTAYMQRVDETLQKVVKALDSN